MAQARALGAIGVLPKTMEYDELRTILANLNLLPGMESRPATAEGFATVTSEGYETDDAAENAYELSEQLSPNLDLLASDAIKPAANTSTQGHQTKQIDFILRHHESVLAGCEKSLSEKLQRIERQNSEIVARVRPAGGNGTVTRLFVGFIASLSVVSILFYQEIESARQQRLTLISQLQKMEQQNMALHTRYRVPPNSSLTEPRLIFPALPTPLPPVVKQEKPAFTLPKILPVHFDYGEYAFSDQRLPWLRRLLEQLEKSKFEGKVHLTSHLARFCLYRGDDGDLSLGDDSQPLGECLFSESDPLIAEQEGAFQSITFSNLINELSDQKITVVLETAGLASPITPYPAIDPTLTANDWNRIARANQRISAHLEYLPLPATSKKRSPIAQVD